MTRRNKPPRTIESSTDIAESIAAESLTAIRTEIRGIVTGKIKPKEHDAASRIAWLAQKASAIGAEQRKAEAAERKRIAELNYGDVLAYIRQLSTDRRAHLMREVQALEETRSVLA